MKKKPQRGGARKGAGRKAKEPTVVVRIPESKLEAVKKLISDDHSEDAIRYGTFRAVGTGKGTD